MGWIKKNKKVESGHKDWISCDCHSCNEYRRRILLECRIALAILSG